MRKIKLYLKIVGLFFLNIFLIPIALADNNGFILRQQPITITTTDSAKLAAAANNAIQQTLSQRVTANSEVPLSSAPIDIYPVHSASLTPGQLTPRSQSNLLLPQPIFLVGNDELSYHWLEKNTAELQQLHAIGFLVEAQSDQDYQHIRTIIGELPLIPLSADAFAKAWNLTHYPVLISSQGIEQ